jgi:hypothetical protein
LACCLAGCFLSGFFVWLVVSPSFCLNQDLQDMRDFQDGRLIVCERFSGSTIFV